jgi:hypothetical protein
MTPSMLKSFLVQAMNDMGIRDVHLTHNESPRKDEYADYEVSYEAMFEPQSKEASRLTIWLTKDGRVAIGLDDCARVAARLGVRSSRSGFAGGHEPLSVSTTALAELVSLVARGRMLIKTRVAPVIGLVTSAAVVSSDDLQLLGSQGYPTQGWVHGLPVSELDAQSVLRFEPWESLG